MKILKYNYTYILYFFFFFYYSLFILGNILFVQLIADTHSKVHTNQIEELLSTVTTFISTSQLFRLSSPQDLKT